MFKTTTIALLAALTLTAAPAAARPGEGALPGIRVSYADLNLTSAAGLAELDRRILRAVHAVCPASAEKSLAMASATAECRLAARNSAGKQRAVAVAAARQAAQLASIR